MIGILVRNSDNRIVSLVQNEDAQGIAASTPAGQTFYENVTVDKERLRFAYYDGSAVTYSKTQTQIDLENAWVLLRRDRDELLLSSDHTQVNDAPFTDDQKSAWRTYRQALRDLPANTSDPKSPVFPSAPS
jgi:hypothetical protein